MPQDLYAGRGAQRTGILCPHCHHDWSFHYTYEHECRFLLGGRDGYELCDCKAQPPDGLHITVVGADDVSRVEVVDGPRTKVFRK